MEEEEEEVNKTWNREKYKNLATKWKYSDSVEQKLLWARVCVCVAVVENMFTILAETHNNNNKNVNKIEKKAARDLYKWVWKRRSKAKQSEQKQKKNEKKHFADNKAKLNCETWLMWCAVVRVHDIDTI